MARRSNFTEAQKAQLFALHRAICVYCEEKLWLLDNGATPYFTIDWADHVFPVARGGASTIENGVCSCGYCNKKKRACEEAPGNANLALQDFELLSRKLEQVIG